MTTRGKGEKPSGGFRKPESSFPVPVSQNATTPPQLPVTKVLPPAAKARVVIWGGPGRRKTSLPVAASRNERMPDSPRANALPLGEKARRLTTRPLPHRCRSLPVALYHKRISWPPEARVRPSGEKARQ